MTGQTLISHSLTAALDMAAFGRIFSFSLLMAVIAVFFEQVSTFRKADQSDYLLCALLSVLGYVVTSYFIPIVKDIMLRNEMWGYDINKNGRENDIKVYVQETKNRFSIFVTPDFQLLWSLLHQICSNFSYIVALTLIHRNLM